MHLPWKGKAKADLENLEKDLKNFKTIYNDNDKTVKEKIAYLQS